MHPSRRQIFAGKPYSTFWNIRDLLIHMINTTLKICKRQIIYICTYFPLPISVPVIERHLFIILVPQHPKLCQLKGSHCNVHAYSELAPFHLSLRDFDRVLENDPTNHRIAWRGCQGASVGEVVSWRELLFLQYINIWMQYNTKTNEYCTYHPWSLWWYPQAAVINCWNVNKQSKRIQ